MSGVAIDVPVPATGPVGSAAPGFRALFDALFGAPATVDGDRASWQLNEGQLTIRATAETALSLRTGEPQASPFRIAATCQAAAPVVPGLGHIEPT
jgi:hypothetical protein